MLRVCLNKNHSCVQYSLDEKREKTVFMPLINNRIEK
jgi:hypothetical protein